jgi:hypothetical protein
MLFHHQRDATRAGRRSGCSGFYGLGAEEELGADRLIGVALDHGKDAALAVG